MAPTTMTADKEQVRSSVDETNRQFMDAIRRGDADAAADVYTDDASVLPPDMAMLKGRDAARALWSGAMQQMGLKEARLESVQLEVENDTGYEIGRYTLTIQPPGAQPVEARGKYVVVWKHVRGMWKWHVDIWNSDAPAK